MKTSQKIALKPEQILLETDRFWYVNKPSGWPTIPGMGIPRGSSLSERLQVLCGKKAWTVHRLDQGTSGVIVFAKDEDAHREGSLFFQNRETRKSYRFIASGVPAEPIFKVNSPIEGKKSLTQFRKLRAGTAHFEGEAVIATGRRHQIRLHLKTLGHLILGDEKYGGEKRSALGLEAEQFCLHAEALQVPGDPRVVAPLPEYWEGFCQRYLN